MSSELFAATFPKYDGLMPVSARNCWISGRRSVAMTEDNIRYSARRQAPRRIKSTDKANLRKINSSQAESAYNKADGQRPPPDREGDAMAKTKKSQTEAEMPDWWQRMAAAMRAYVEKGNSWPDISRGAGFTRNATAWELVNKRNMPHVDTFLKICDAIEVSPISILLGFDWTEDEQRAAQILARLGPEGQALVIRFAEEQARARQRRSD
jgi:hypothetical protein